MLLAASPLQPLNQTPSPVCALAANPPLAWGLCQQCMDLLSTSAGAQLLFGVQVSQQSALHSGISMLSC